MIFRKYWESLKRTQVIFYTPMFYMLGYSIQVFAGIKTFTWPWFWEGFIFCVGLTAFMFLATLITFLIIHKNEVELFKGVKKWLKSAKTSALNFIVGRDTSLSAFEGGTLTVKGRSGPLRRVSTSGSMSGKSLSKSSTRSRLR